MIKSICVYCGSATGVSPAYANAARALAAEMVKRDIALVYGGGNVGLMGIIATEVLHLGGQVTGVIPTALLDKELGHDGLTKLHVVKDMHERKALMAELSDGFIAMPGGMGTMEELFEVLTWSQLGFHVKPIGILNVEGFYDGLISFLEHMVNQGFLSARQAMLMMSEHKPEQLLERFQHYQPMFTDKWLDHKSASQLLP